MGAVFSSLYREIHYIQVHFIKVWVYNYSNVSIVLFCKAKFLCVTVSCEEFLLLVPTLFASLKSIVRRFERVSPSPQLHTPNQSRVEHSSSHIVTHYIFHKQYTTNYTTDNTSGLFTKFYQGRQAHHLSFLCKYKM